MQGHWHALDRCGGQNGDSDAVIDTMCGEHGILIRDSQKPGLNETTSKWSKTPGSDLRWIRSWPAVRHGLLAFYEDSNKTNAYKISGDLWDQRSTWIAFCPLQSTGFDKIPVRLIPLTPAKGHQ